MDNVIVKKVIHLPKVGYFSRRKINAVDITVEVVERGGNEVFVKGVFAGYTPKYMEFSACGAIWNATHTDWVSGGQNLDEIEKLYPGNKKVQQIVAMWRKWHLNGLHAGTEEQECALKRHRQECKAEGYTLDYDMECDYLKLIGLYEVEYTGMTIGRMYDHEMYKYGHAWLVRELPEYVIKWAKEL